MSNETEDLGPGTKFGMSATPVWAVGKALKYQVTDITSEALMLEDETGLVFIIGWGLIDAIRRGLTAREDVERGKSKNSQPPGPGRHVIGGGSMTCWSCGLEPPEIYNHGCKGTK